VTPSAAYAVAMVGIATFSCMDAFMKGLSIEIGAYNAMLWRSIIGLAMSIPMFAVWGRGWPGRSTAIIHLKRSVAAGISVLLFFWGLARVPMAEGVTLTFLSPIIALFLAALMLGEQIRRRTIGASLLAFAGVGVILSGRAGGEGGPDALHGALAIILAGMFYAYNLVLLRRSALLAGPVEITFFTNLVFVGLYGIAAPVAATVPDAGQVLRLSAAAALAILSSLALAWAYAHAEAQRLVTVEYTAFVWATILGAIVFGERLLPLTVAGAALIIAGSILAARGRAAPAPATEAAA
jgi:S-adenosylmethionine uptake transporter